MSDEELYYMHKDTGVTVPFLPTWESDMDKEVGERAAICQVKLLSTTSSTGFSRHIFPSFSLFFSLPPIPSSVLVKN